MQIENFCGGVGCDVRDGLKRGCGGDDENVAGFFLQHRLKEKMREADDGGAVDLHHFDLARAVGGGEFAVSAEAGVVDEQIDVEIFRAGESEDRVGRGGIGEICDADFGADVVFGGEVARECGEAIFAASCEHEICAGGG